MRNKPLDIDPIAARLMMVSEMLDRAVAELNAVVTAMKDSDALPAPSESEILGDLQNDLFS